MNDFDLLQSPGELTRWIRNARPPRDRVDASKPHGFFLEREPAADGRIVTSAAILLVNRECPWTCLMCDLWKQTVTYTVAPGDIPRQIEYALTEIKARPEQG